MEGARHGVDLALHHTITTITNGAHLSTYARNVCSTVRRSRRAGLAHRIAQNLQRTGPVNEYSDWRRPCIQGQHRPSLVRSSLVARMRSVFF